MSYTYGTELTRERMRAWKAGPIQRNQLYTQPRKVIQVHFNMTKDLSSKFSSIVVSLDDVVLIVKQNTPY
jgi:hypothetical protein